MLFILWALFLLLPTSLSSTNEGFDFFVPNGLYHSSKLTKIQPFSIRYTMSLSPLEISTYFDAVKLAASNYKALSFLQGESPLKTTFATAIDPGIADFSVAHTQLQLAYEILTPLEISLQNTCYFEAEVLDKTTVETESNLIKDFITHRISNAWTPDKMIADNGQMALLETFVNLYNSVAQNWRILSSKMVQEIDDLEVNTIPDYLKGNLENLDCVANTKFEKINVQQCRYGKASIICDLLFIYPTQISSYIQLIPINYDGVIISGLKRNSIFVKNPESQMIISMNCDSNEYIQSALPVCHEEKDYDDCLTSLTQKSIDSIIKKCNFIYENSTSMFPLLSGALLVQNNHVKDFKIAVDGRPVYQKLPLLIYSAAEIVIKSVNEEYVFPKLTNVTKILSTRLSSDQIHKMMTNCWWYEFLNRHNWDDYVLWIIIIIQTLTFPLICWSCCATCCEKRRKNRKNPDYYVDREIKRRNYLENKRLLEHRKKQCPV